MTAHSVLDTNTLIYAINQGRLIMPHFNTVSIITEIELLSYSKLTEQDKIELKKVLQWFHIEGLTRPIKEMAIELRYQTGLKLPDSIVLATAEYLKLPLITSDKRLLNIATTAYELKDIQL